MHNHEKHGMAFGKVILQHKMPKMKEMMNNKLITNFNAVGKKNNQTSVFCADREIPTLESTDNAGNLVNLVSGIIRLPSGWDFSVCIGD